VAEVTDKHAHIRLDYAESAIKEHAAEITELRGALGTLDTNSQVRHEKSQAQNAAIILQNEQIITRLNQPSAAMAVLADPVKVGGLVTLLGALVAAAAAFGYAQSPPHPVLVPTMVPAPDDATP
jgi:Tfp pilus assembly protein PilW